MINIFTLFILVQLANIKVEHQKIEAVWLIKYSCHALAGLLKFVPTLTNLEKGEGEEFRDRGGVGWSG